MLGLHYFIQRREVDTKNELGSPAPRLTGLKGRNSWDYYVRPPAIIYFISSLLGIDVADAYKGHTTTPNTMKGLTLSLAHFGSTLF
jgi:hypothetical protein